MDQMDKVRNAITEFELAAERGRRLVEETQANEVRQRKAEAEVVRQLDNCCPGKAVHYGSKRYAVEETEEEIRVLFVQESADVFLESKGTD